MSETSRFEVAVKHETGTNRAASVAVTDEQGNVWTIRPERFRGGITIHMHDAPDGAGFDAAVLPLVGNGVQLINLNNHQTQQQPA